MTLNADILQYIEHQSQEAFDLLVELAQIPAPSHYEDRRAAFCKKWLEDHGAEGVYIDEAKNVIYPVGCTADNPLVVIAAHTDVVFPDTDPLPLRVEDGKIFCPGVGDDTAHVVALLTVARYVAQTKRIPKDCGILFVANACEEGLGNLKGIKALMEHYGSRVKEFISLDGPGDEIVNKAVGSKRYKVEIDTEGGHSYNAFGNRNAIAYLASLIGTLYDMKVPQRGNTTYNVGTISGGTSVNTIAQHAEMLYEFRSDNLDDFREMEQHFNAALDYYRTKGIQVTCTLVGDRPCASDVDTDKLNDLVARAFAATETHMGFKPHLASGSTDCNIPLSMGIPSIMVSCGLGHGAHTREEYFEIASQIPGLKVAFQMVLHYF